MAVQSQKLKILYLMKILLQKTDEHHVMTANDLCRELKEYGIDAERKSIYNDLETLEESGMDIVQVKGSNQGYYVGTRDFEIAELKLLVDAVQSSKFITAKKSRELIKKLASLVSQYDEKLLERQVYMLNRPKTGNETIFYNVDAIHLAILHNHQITFQYSEWTIQKKLQIKKDGKYYKVSPWALTWDDENYYLIAYDAEADSIKHYRVDKMLHLAMSEEIRQGKHQFADFDLAAFAKKTFGMYGGEDAHVMLLCHNHLAGVVIDRFGKDVMMIPTDSEHFKVTVLVTVSSQFFGWVTAVGREMRIVGPEEVKEEYKDYILEIAQEY